MRRQPAIAINLELEELPRVHVVADSEEDAERLRLWLDHSPAIRELFELAYALSAERRAA